MDNAEKLATLGTQDTKTNKAKNTTQYVLTPPYTREKAKTNKGKKHNTICDGHHFTQTNTNNLNKK